MPHNYTVHSLILATNNNYLITDGGDIIIMIMYQVYTYSSCSYITSIYLDQVSTDCPESSNDFNEVVVTTRVKLVLQPLVQVGRERLHVLVW